MAGLLGVDYLSDDPTQQQAQKAGLLNFGAQMLLNSNRGFGGALGAGLLGGSEGYTSAYKNALDIQQKQQTADLTKRLFSEIGGGAQPSTMPQAQAALAQGAQAGSVGPTAQNAATMSAMPAAAPRPTGLTLPTLQMASILGIKNADTLFNTYKYQNDGIERKAGTFYQNPVTGQREYVSDPTKGFAYDPSTNTVAPIAGYNDTIAAQEGAKARATASANADYQPLPLGYTGQDGRPLGGSVGGYIRTTSAPQQAPSTSRFDGLDVSKLSPQQVAFLQSKDPQAFANGVNRFSNSVQAAGQAVQPQGAPVLQSEAEKTAQIGKIQGVQGAQNDLNKNWITSSLNPVIEQGKAAQASLANLDALRNIDIKTGWGAEAQANSAAFLTSLGLAPKNAQMYAANAQKFQSVAMDRLLTNLQAQKGPQTEGDSTRAQAVFAQLNNTPEANAFIADFARAKANMDARKSQFYQDALPLAKAAGDLTEIDRRWQKIQGSIWSDPVLQPYVKKDK
jgi:hypothetical protein